MRICPAAHSSQKRALNPVEIEGHQGAQQSSHPVDCAWQALPIRTTLRSKRGQEPSRWQARDAHDSPSMRNAPVIPVCPTTSKDCNVALLATVQWHWLRCSERLNNHGPLPRMEAIGCNSAAQRCILERHLRARHLFGPHSMRPCQRDFWLASGTGLPRAGVL